MEIILPKEKYKPYTIDIAEELVVCISQYKAVDYTVKALRALKKDNIPFTSIVLFDGTNPDDLTEDLGELTDIMLYIRKGIHSLPHLWNILYGVAKLTCAKYMLWQDCDIELKEGSLTDMLELIKVNGIDIVSPKKIDKDREKFNQWKPISSSKYEPIIGFNDSCVIFKLEKLPFFPYDYDYAPYQFEISALSYDLYKLGLKSVLANNAIAFHHCSQDIQHSPKEREYGSKNWDNKKEIFLSKPDKKSRKEFLDKVIMNSENANKYGFPCFLGDKL